MIKAFVIKYYVYISIVIMCLLSVGMTFKSYQLSLERYNNKVLVAEKTTLTNSLADATERQQIIIKALKENYKKNIYFFKFLFAWQIFSNIVHSTI